MPASTGFYTDPFHLWWRPSQPNEIHLVTSETIFNTNAGDHPGLWVTFSCNPKSANYHPQNFNRAARALKAKGLPHPAETPEHDRRLNHRAALIAKWVKQTLSPAPA